MDQSLSSLPSSPVIPPVAHNILLSSDHNSAQQGTSYKIASPSSSRQILKPLALKKGFSLSSQASNSSQINTLRSGSISDVEKENQSTSKETSIFTNLKENSQAFIPFSSSHTSTNNFNNNKTLDQTIKFKQTPHDSIKKSPTSLKKIQSLTSNTQENQQISMAFLELIQQQMISQNQTQQHQQCFDHKYHESQSKQILDEEQPEVQENQKSAKWSSPKLMKKLKKEVESVIQKSPVRENLVESINQNIKEIKDHTQADKSQLNQEQQPIQLIQEYTQITKKPQEKKNRICNCKKTKCLKLYCDCFAAGEFCGGECNCSDCSNIQSNSSARNKVVEALLEKNPFVFNGKEINTQDIAAYPPKLQQKLSSKKGCNCKKSGCLKKYCQCYQDGLTCGEQCKCSGCENCSESSQNNINNSNLNNFAGNDQFTLNSKYQKQSNLNNSFQSENDQTASLKDEQEAENKLKHQQNKFGNSFSIKENKNNIQLQNSKIIQQGIKCQKIVQNNILIRSPFGTTNSQQQVTDNFLSQKLIDNSHINEPGQLLVSLLSILLQQPQSLLSNPLAPQLFSLQTAQPPSHTEKSNLFETLLLSAMSSLPN